jgi:hypothetical protein
MRKTDAEPETGEAKGLRKGAEHDHTRGLPQKRQRAGPTEILICLIAYDESLGLCQKPSDRSPG